MQEEGRVWNSQEAITKATYWERSVERTCERNSSQSSNSRNIVRIRCSTSGGCREGLCYFSWCCCLVFFTISRRRLTIIHVFYGIQLVYVQVVQAMINTIEAADPSLLTLVNPSQRSFCVSNAIAKDNPIVYASPGFMELTGYDMHGILGHNCRLLQGKETDRNEVRINIVSDVSILWILYSWLTWNQILFLFIVLF